MNESVMLVFGSTAEALTALPAPVRDALDLAVGDDVAYAIGEGQVGPTEARTRAATDPFRPFDERDGEADRIGQVPASIRSAVMEAVAVHLGRP